MGYDKDSIIIKDNFKLCLRPKVASIAYNSAMKKLLGIFKKITLLPKKWLVIPLIILAISFLIFRPKTNPATQPQFASVERGTLKQQVSASGTLQGKNRSDLRFISAGKLATVSVKVGDSVTAGQVIATFDTTQLSANLQQAENNLRAQQANVEKVLDDIHQFQSSNQTSGETETQKNTRTTAETTRDSAVDSVKAAQSALNNSVLISPIDGTITSQNPLPGQNVSLTDVIATVEDFSQIVLAADVDESDIGKISLGQRADFTLNAYGNEDFVGSVSDISSETHTTPSGATVVTVKISVNNNAIKPIAGLSGDVNITIAQIDNVLIIPSSSLRDDNNVLVKQGKAINPVKVVPGLSNDTQVEIKEGLKEGDQVVTNPSVIKNSSGGFIFRRS